MRDGGLPFDNIVACRHRRREQIDCDRRNRPNETLKKASDNKGSIHHSDRGSKYLSIKYSGRLAEAEIDLSVGTTGSADNDALAKCGIGLFKTEVIRQIDP